MTEVQEIMTTNVICVNKEATLDKVVQLLAQHDVSGFPVLDAENRVVGIVSETDIVKYAYQVSVVPLISSSKWVSPHTEINDIAAFRQGIDLLARTKVDKVMSKKVITVVQDAPVEDIAKIMNRHKINRIPVVDNDQKIAGIVTRADIIDHLASKAS